MVGYWRVTGEKSRDFWKILLTRRKKRSNLENVEAFLKLISIIYLHFFVRENTQFFVFQTVNGNTRPGMPTSS